MSQPPYKVSSINPHFRGRNWDMKLFSQSKAWRGRDWTLGFVLRQGARIGGLFGPWAKAEEGSASWHWSWGMLRKGGRCCRVCPGRGFRARTLGGSRLSVTSSLGCRGASGSIWRTKNYVAVSSCRASCFTSVSIPMDYGFGQESFPGLCPQWCCVTLRNFEGI